ncbi:sulfatase [Candidatus Hydrogenedentota bacterium]
MKVVLLVIDSLNRNYLSMYGGTEFKTPNLDRLAGMSAVFENHYVGTLPTMPARREMYAGQMQIFQRPWTPLEPWDKTVTWLMRKHDKMSMLVTDNYHFFERGGYNYYTDYSGFEFIRGHEKDAWKTHPIDPGPEFDFFLKDQAKRAPYYLRNVRDFKTEADFFSPKVMQATADWIEGNHTHEQFFLVVESFDVHEPFHVPEPYASMYSDYKGEFTIWPQYTDPMAYPPEMMKHIRAQYGGKMTMLDKWLGKVFDKMDQHKLWDDTIFIMTSDHGHYLGEHNKTGKNFPFAHNIIAHVPLTVYMPGGKLNGTRVDALTQTVDLYPTLLEMNGEKQPENTHGASLMPILKGEKESVRDAALFGYFRSPVSVTDGKYVLHKWPATEDGGPVYQYGVQFEVPGVLDPLNEVYEKAEVGKYLPHVNFPVYRVPWGSKYNRGNGFDRLFDLTRGEEEENNIAEEKPDEVKRLEKLLVEEMKKIDAPDEAYVRFGLEK